jgi:hypothetical protein
MILNVCLAPAFYPILRKSSKANADIVIHAPLGILTRRLTKTMG